MEIIATEEKPKSLPAFSGPPPTMHPIPPPDRSHPPPPTGPSMYEQPWRHHPPPFDGHPAEQRRTPGAPQPPLPSHGYPVMGNRELPQLPPDGPYVRQGSLPGPAPTAPEAHPSHPAYPPMNGTHEPSPHSAPPEYRGRMPFSSQEAHSNGDAPPAQYSTPVPPHLSHTPAPYDSAYYNNPAFGIRQQRKAARAQQVCCRTQPSAVLTDLSFFFFWNQACDQCRARKAKCDEGRPACSHCKENNLICVYKEVPPHKSVVPVFHGPVRYANPPIDKRKPRNYS